MNSLEGVRAFQIELEFGSVGFFFKERGSTGVPEEKPFEGIKGENQQQTQPRYGMCGTAGFEPGHIGGRRVLSPPVTFAPHERHLIVTT